MPIGCSSLTSCSGSPQAWWAATRPCSIEVAARAGNPITSPTA